MDLLVVGAHPPELRGLRDRVGDRLDGTVEGLHVSGKTIGVGMGVAGASTAKRVFQLRPRAVVLLGTCGVYPGLSGCQPHDVIVANGVSLLDGGVSEGRSAWPAPMQTELPTNEAISAGLAAAGARVHRLRVGSPLAQTCSETLAGLFGGGASGAKSRCGAECLEAFAVAHACHLAEVPFAAALGVTHVAGPKGEQDYARYAKESAVAAADVLFNWVHGGAVGLPHA